MSDMKISNLQRDILGIIQRRFPVALRPFKVLANQLGVDEAEVIQQIRLLQRSGVIRYIGPVFDARRLGYVSTLVAAQVPGGSLQGFVGEVNALPGVSHNYGREHRFNVWFTLTVPADFDIEGQLLLWQRKYQLAAIHSLPAVRLYKLRVEFSLGSEPAKPVNGYDTAVMQRGTMQTQTNITITDRQKRLIRKLQQPFVLVAEPFAEMAAQLQPDWSLSEIISQLQQWQADGTIRKFGAAVHHTELGYTVNAMVVFTVAEDDIDGAGRKLSSYQQVSHCYYRRPVAGWPYNLFAMTHCKSDEELQVVVKEMLVNVKPVQYDVLRTVKKYKKASVKYFAE